MVLLMKERTCCFTGHRVIPREESANLQSKLEKAVVSLIEKGYRFFGAGGALGFDTMAAQTILKLKKQYPQIRLILVLPCKEQTRNWKSEDIVIYNDILHQADKVVYTSDSYYNGCMQKRNRHLVDCSSVCITYCTKSTGGTAYTINYAHKHQVPVIQLSCSQEIENANG